MFGGMLEGLKEGSGGFLFNFSGEAAPAPAVAPVAAPTGLAQFAAEAAAKAQERAVATKERPAALRAKGIDDNAPPLTYTGPSEDGSAAVQRSSGALKHAATTGATPHERRETRGQQSMNANDVSRR